jgi:DNA-directed RNA polymerase specialized sigma24 family protein
MGTAFTIAESKELNELLTKYVASIWRLAVKKCGNNEHIAEELYAQSLKRISDRVPPEWADWWVAKAAGKSFMYFVRGVMMREQSNMMKRAKNDPTVRFAGNMTADTYASTERYHSQEQVASDRDMFVKTRAKLAEKGEDLAVKCLDLITEGVADYEQMAEKLGVDVTRIYKASERAKAVAREILEGDES